MAKYIDAEALIDDLLGLAEANKGTYHEEGFKNAITVVEMQDPADVVDKERYAKLLANSIIVCEALKKYQSADMVERKDLDKITEAHEQIGYEKGFRDGYAEAMEEAIKAVGRDTWAGSRISRMQPKKFNGRRDDEESTKGA